jgi:putative ubiquitin-RnfH superfamily antitoxin RatB of RatAB toxin-antitoxin module
MTIGVTVAYAAPGIEALAPVHVADGARLIDAVVASALVERLALDLGNLRFAIHGQRATADTLLADGDRVELTRPLLADAKALRRERANATPRRKKIQIAKPKP